MASADRLSHFDKALLDLEAAGPSHMHVALVLLFKGRAPSYQALAELVESRLPLVPRYRQRFAFVPFEQGLPLWVDDTHFNLYYHLRMTALPGAADERALEELAGEIFSQRLPRDRPLWELWLVERVAKGRFALIAKAHHVLVDGEAGRDLTTVLLDRTPADGELPPPPPPFSARPEPGPVKLVGEAWLERFAKPRALLTQPSRWPELPLSLLRRTVSATLATGTVVWQGLRDPAPECPLNVPIGPLRRCRFFSLPLARLRAVRDALGGSVNDVALAAIAVGLGRYLREHGTETQDLTLRVLVPVAVAAPQDGGGGALRTMRLPLPVGIDDPREVHRQIAAASRRESNRTRALAARVLTELAGFAQPTILSQAARLQVGPIYANLVVTNVPGPQLPLYLLGRPLLGAYPVMPLPRNHALSIALMSYNGAVHFGLLADYDALPDLELLAQLIPEGLEALQKKVAPPGRRRSVGTGTR